MLPPFRNFVLTFLVVTLIVILAGCNESIEFTSQYLRSEIFFQAEIAGKLDLVIALDSSDSFKDNINYVVDHFNRFLWTIKENKEVDFHVVVVTTDYMADHGNLVRAADGSFLVSSQSADPQADFEKIVKEIKSSPTSFWEQGLENVYRAISDHGADFLRSDAGLGVMIMSDEDDFSCEDGCDSAIGPPENNLDKWIPFKTEKYSNFFKSLKDKSGQLPLIFPIVGLDASAYPCSGVNTGRRYLDVQYLVGTGFPGSVCNNDLSSSYARVADRLSKSGIVFKLKEKPDPNSLRVSVNGIEVTRSTTDGWDFNTETQTINFFGPSIPSLGAAIEVVYSMIR